MDTTIEEDAKYLAAVQQNGLALQSVPENLREQIEKQLAEARK